MRKSLILILAILLSLTLGLGLSSCVKSEDGEEQTSASTTNFSSSTPAESALILAENGKTELSIVYQSQAVTDVIKSIDSIKNHFSEKYGVELSATPDSLHTQDDDKLEILLGKTKYSESEAAEAALDANSCSVSVKGNKIVIATNHLYLFTPAVEQLLNNLIYEDGVVLIEKDFSFTSKSYDSVSISESKTTDYSIVYESGSKSAQEAAARLRLAFADCGIDIAVCDDSTSLTDREISVGNTNREISATSEAYYQNAWLGVDEKGNIAVTGNIACAIETFAEYITTLGNGGDIVITENMLGIFNPPRTGMPPLYEGGGEVEVTKNLSHSNSFFITVHNASKSDFKDYTDLLADNGYTCHRATKENGNIFETWTDGYTILTMSHIAYTDPTTQDKLGGTEGIGFVRYMMIAVDCTETSALPICEPDVEKITTPCLTTLSEPSGNMGYVLRLEDGRFIIIDGGFRNPHTTEIYNTINAQNVLDGKPVIAAWLITHPHTDHIEASLEFLKTYASNVEIQAYVHNLPGEELMQKYGVSDEEISNLKTRWYDPLYERLRVHSPSTRVIIAHAGQRFEYGSTKIDVLYTSENFYKKKMRDTNSSSVVYSITGNSGRMIILGDQQEDGCALLNAIYEDTLKCDLVQVAHHGYNGGDTEMYASMAAKYAIWPSSYQDIIERNAHYNPSYGRNFFDFRTVEYNIIPYDGKEPLTLYEGMTKAELAKLDVGLTIPQ
ncbi:MAG: MBL fold metallo-hydrolase [Clostridia bacterium]|nr:MBL fold metallo-hydrolase [Clostridia bacterium]